jgi:uncharacterized RDD family membrane protein YckC
VTGRASTTLETPEGVALELPLAPVLERLLALGLDLGLIFAATIAVAVVGALLAGFSPFGEPWALVLVAIFLVRHGYFAFFEIRWHGATPGKRLLGLRAISRDGGGLTPESVFARNLMRDVELFLPLLVVIAPEALVGRSPLWLSAPAVAWVGVMTLMPVLTRDRLRAGDLVGGTLVVRVPEGRLLRDQATQATSTHATSMHAASDIAFTRQQLSVYGEHELETLADVLRKAELGVARDYDLAVVARAIARKIRYDGPEPRTAPLTFLRSFYRAQRTELERRLLFGTRVASKRDR